MKARRRPRRRGRAEEAKLAGLYGKALEVGRSVGDRMIGRLIAGLARDAAYYGAWLASNAMDFERRRKR